MAGSAEFGPFSDGCPWQQARALNEEKVSVTLSAFLLSVLSAPGSDGMRDHPSRPHSPEQEDLLRYRTYRKLFPVADIALAATALRNRAFAKWAREHPVAVDVHTGEELAVAIAAGVRLRQLTVHAEALTESELTAVVNLGVGRVVAGSVRHIDLLRSVVAKRSQDVVIRMTDSNMPILAIAGNDDQPPCGFRFDSHEADTAIAAVLDHEWLNLVGLHCEVGSQDHDFVSYPAAIGHMIAEMAHVRRNHGDVLTRLGLGGGRAVPSGDWELELPQLAGQIDESLDDACGTLRFPRPVVVVSTGLGIIGRSAA